MPSKLKMLLSAPNSGVHTHFVKTRRALRDIPRVARSSRRSLQFAYSEDPTEMEGCTEDELYDFEHEIMVVQNALYMYNSTTLEADKSLIFHTAQVGGLVRLPFVI